MRFSSEAHAALRSAANPYLNDDIVRTLCLIQLRRLLRRMRAFASGLGAAFDPAPIRLLRLPRQAVELLAGYREDPAWSDEALTAVSAGGKTAMAFVGWARELGRVYDEQPHVQGFLK